MPVDLVGMKRTGPHGLRFIPGMSKVVLHLILTLNMWSELLIPQKNQKK